MAAELQEPAGALCGPGSAMRKLQDLRVARVTAPHTQGSRREGAFPSAVGAHGSSPVTLNGSCLPPASI